MNKFLKYLGLFTLVIIVFVIGLISYSSFTSVDKEKVFIPFIKDNIVELTQWKYDTYKRLMVKPEDKVNSEKQLKLHLNWFKKLGVYKSMETPVFISSSTTHSQEKGKLEYVTYNIPIDFDTGRASITLTLVYNQNTVKIHHIRYNSDTLFRE